MAAGMTPFNIRLDAWAMMAVSVLLLAAAAIMWRRRRRLAGFVLLAGTIVGLAFLYFLGTGGFCVAPPGSACA